MPLSHPIPDPDVTLAILPLTGSVRVLIQFDVCEEIRLDRLQQIIEAAPCSSPTSSIRRPRMCDTSVRPCRCRSIPCCLSGGERLTGEIKYYDYGVVSVIFELPFSGDWESLVRLASRWVWDMDFASPCRAHRAPASRARRRRHGQALFEAGSARTTSSSICAMYTGEPAGSGPYPRTRPRNRPDRARRPAALSVGECAEVLQSHISYYENDLAVIGWNAAFLFDTAAGAETGDPVAGVRQLAAPRVPPLR